MAAPPFKVKASYDYNPDHEEDLDFLQGQIITVTELEDEDWYVGEYADGSGAVKSGLFPKNFVERYEPAPPPRPVRSARPKPAEKVAEPQMQEPEPEPEVEDEPLPTPKAEPEAQPDFMKSSIPPPAQEPESAPVITSKPVDKHSEPRAAPKPVNASSAAKSPPPVAEKPSSFKDRIAAFNKAAAAPIAPFKPSGLGSTGFIKKPFVAPPPSRNAYVPPPREPVQQKVYRREEDPEIAERRARDQENAEKSGLVASTSADQDEDAPQTVSLKERVALLQKRQAEQAARLEAGAKEKPKRPPKKRLESHEKGDAAEERAVAPPIDPPPRESFESTGEPSTTARPPKVPKPSEHAPRKNIVSDGNDADQSAAGETTEDAEGTSGSVGDDDDVREIHPAQTSTAPQHHEEEEEEEDSTEEDEMDEEARHQMALRERMAKLSGGMGMGAMFGPPGGMPMMGMGASSKKKKAQEPKAVEEEPTPMARAPRIPGIPMPGLNRTMSVESSASTEIQSGDDMKSQVVPRSAPAPPRERATQPEHNLTDRRPPSPPIDTSLSSRAPPLPPIRSPTPGSESGDELPGDSQHVEAIDVSGPSVPSRSFPQSPPTQQESFSAPVPPSQAASDKRSSRGPPPIPLSSPTQSRAPPPPPPSAAPPSRQSTSDSLNKRIIRGGAAGESEYEGDYDTDIAPGATHKEALKAHIRESSPEEMTNDDIPTRSRPPVPTSPVVTQTGATRAAPPLPSQPPPTRGSLDSPRAPPPPVPPRDVAVELDEDGEEYDPYRYTGPPLNPRTPPPAPVSAQRFPPPVPATARQEIEDDTDEELYSSPPPRADRPPPLPPQGPPPPADKPAPPPRQQSQVADSFARAPRPSTEADRSQSTPSRRSTEQPRSSIDQGYIARDVDLGQPSQWWTQPNKPPPVFQDRQDVLFEIEESSTSKRGGKTTISKDVYALFQDYSQTIVTARYDSRNVNDVSLEQRHQGPPQKLRQDQLEDAHGKFGNRIAADVNSKQNTVVGDGSPQSLVVELLRPLQVALHPVGTRAYGALVYANLANASVQQYDEIRAGDIVTFRNAKFQGKHGGLHQKYQMEAGKPDHVGVVIEWDGTKKKIRAAEQGRESKKCKIESFRLGDLRSGEVRVWRVMPRSWVGWEGEN